MEQEWTVADSVRWLEIEIEEADRLGNSGRAEVYRNVVAMLSAEPTAWRVERSANGRCNTWYTDDSIEVEWCQTAPESGAVYTVTPLYDLSSPQEGT